MGHDLNRKCAVMQPTYLSWAGYYNLIINSDVFVFLDDAQYSKNSFFNRNRYPVNSEAGFSWLTIPVKSEKLGQKINETSFADNIWRTKHLATIRHVYNRHQGYKELFPILEKELLNPKLDTLSEISISLCMSICELLGLKKKFYKSSELNLTPNRSEKLVEICELFNCDTYLSPAGAQGYIEEDNILPISNINVVYQKFECLPYSQRGVKKFQPYMSCIDLIFNLGKDQAITYLNKQIV